MVEKVLVPFKHVGIGYGSSGWVAHCNSMLLLVNGALEFEVVVV